MAENSQKDKNSKDSNSIYSVLGELIISLVPFLVIGIIFVYQKKSFYEFIISPEWSFGSSVLFGLSFVRAVEAFAMTKTGVIHERAALSISLLIFVGFVPSLIVLTLILTSSAPQLWLGLAQMILFVLSAFAFLLFGSLLKEVEQDRF